MKENKRKCVKCGSSPVDDPDTKLFRFPKPGSTNIQRCELWAKYIFPNGPWASVDFQGKLYTEHRMLCHRHFKASAFVDIPSKKLRRFASPDAEETTMPHLDVIAGPSQPLPSITNVPGPSQPLQSITNVPGLSQPLQSITNVPGPSQPLQSITNVPGPSQPLQSITNVPGPSQPLQSITNVPGPSQPLQSITNVPGPSQPLQSITNVPGPYQPLQNIINVPIVSVPGPSNICTERPVRPVQEPLLENQPLFDKCKKYLQKISKLQRSLRYMKNKELLQKLNANSALMSLSKKISPTFSLLLQAQIKNQKKNPKGRRWTAEDKIIALRLYKRSPTCYRLMRRMFSLPAPSSLKLLLNTCKLNIGINEHIFNIIAKYASTQKAVNKEFILMFDEMAIKKNLYYNPKEDLIEGFQDHGKQGRTSQPATYALVFMVAGIRKKIKQPIAFYLSSSSVTADRLAVLIKEVLEQCFRHGITITATVCDMDGVNRRALSILGATASSPYFEHNSHEVVALFDPPHLIKCFRNLFLKYDIEWLTDISSDEKTGTGIAKWSHLRQFYELDNANPNYAFAPLLKQDHMNPNTKQKMKVRLAVQVLSHTVAAGMYARIGKGLPTDAVVTADMISQMDKLFDTLNSDSPDLRRGKPFSTNLKESTPHLPFIKEMKKKLGQMKFIGAIRTPPSQEGWLWTLTAIEKIWQTLRHRHKNIKSLAIRRFQQDPLENLFGCIRANCGANCNPTAGQFIGALKTALITNIAHIGIGNCEHDNNDVIIDNFKLLLGSTKPVNEPIDVCTSIASTSQIDNLDISDDILENSSEIQACAYVCGFLMKHYKNNCVRCLNIITAEEHTIMHTFIEFKEFNDFKKTLSYPSKSFVLCVETCATIINSFLCTNAHHTKLKQCCSNVAKENVNFDFLNQCTEHKEYNINFIIKNVFYIAVKRFCIKKNRTFAQDASSSALKKKINILAHK